MSVKIRLKRMGKKKHPYYRVVVIDSRKPRDGRSIEEVGYYHPTDPDKNKQLSLKKERIDAWIQQGAQATETVKNLIKKQIILTKQDP